jgi:hypothetical protein
MPQGLARLGIPLSAKRPSRAEPHVSGSRPPAFLTSHSLPGPSNLITCYRIILCHSPLSILFSLAVPLDCRSAFTRGPSLFSICLISVHQRRSVANASFAFLAVDSASAAVPSCPLMRRGAPPSVRRAAGLGAGPGLSFVPIGRHPSSSVSSPFRAVRSVPTASCAAREPALSLRPTRRTCRSVVTTLRGPFSVGSVSRRRQSGYGASATQS